MRAAIEAAIYGHTPEPNLTVSEWADKHRVLHGRAANEAGPWRTSRTPYLKGIMDALSPKHPAQKVVFMKGAQVGGTECGNNWLGFIIHHAPGPALAVLPTVELAKRASQQRIDPMIEVCPVLRERVAPARKRDSGNTVLSKEFPGGILILTGANSAVGLRSMPARYLFLDEIDAYPASAGDDGDPIDNAIARTRTFSFRRKILETSTPLLALNSRIEAKWDLSDQRKYHVPCPHCGFEQVLQFVRLRWTPGSPQTAHYVCEHCEQPIREQLHKTWILESGRWIATAIPIDPQIVGFHLSSLYSPIGWMSWADIARQWEAAQGDVTKLQQFKNTVLAETWTLPGQAVDWQRIYRLRRGYARGTVPVAAVVLTAGVDVQEDRLEVDVWAWGPRQQRWVVV